MIYLSWSVYQVVLTLIAMLSVFFYLKSQINVHVYPKNRKTLLKLLNMTFLGVFLFSSALAINVGDTKAARYSTNFDVASSAIEPKKENIAPTKESVYTDFSNKLKGE